MKKLLMLLLITIMVLSFAACDGDEKTMESGTEQSTGASAVHKHVMSDGKCTECGWEEESEHSHDFKIVASKNDAAHIVECECGAIEIVPHNFVCGLDEEIDMHYLRCECGYKSELFPHNTDGDGSCTDCDEMGITHICDYSKAGYDDETHFLECECGKKKNVISHSYGTYTKDETHHYRKCSECDYESAEIHNFKVDDIRDVCDGCGYPQPASVGLEFEENGEGYTLIGIGSCSDVKIIVPSDYNGKPVTKVGSSAFEGNGNIVYVKLPDSINSIGSGAFAGCTSLKIVTIPDAVTVIRDNTFMGCSALERVKCRNISKVEMFAFYGCKSFEGFCKDLFFDEVFIPSCHIGDHAFYGCESIALALEFGENAYIGIGAFSGCSSIVSIEMYALNDIMLCGDAFSGCTSLKTVTIWNYCVEYLDIGTFSGCTALEKFRVGYGTLEDYLDFFAESTVDEEMGLSWYDGASDFTVEFIDSPHESGQEIVVDSMKVSELYEYINENYWQ